MNGQYFNSSGSGNGTPTPPSNSSYPASLSSQSSRDPSPQSRDIGTSQYSYSNIEQKSMSQTLVNNISNITNYDPSKHPLPAGVYSPKSNQQQFNNMTTRSHGFTVNHNNSTNTTSNYNSMSNATQYASPPIGPKYNTVSQNSSFNAAAPDAFSGVANVSNQNLPNKNLYSSPINNTVQKQLDFRTTAPSIERQSTQFSPSLNPTSSVPPQLNVSSNQPVPPQVSNVNLFNSSSFNPTKQQTNFDRNSPSRFQGSSEESNSLPCLNTPSSPPVTFPAANPNQHSEESSLLNSTEKLINHKSQTKVPSISTTLHSSQNMFPTVSSHSQSNPSAFSSAVQKPPLVEVGSTVQQELQNKPPSLNTSSTLDTDQKQNEEIGSGDQPVKMTSNLDLAQIKPQVPAQVNPPVAGSQPQMFQNTTLPNRISDQFPPTTQTGTGPWYPVGDHSRSNSQQFRPSNPAIQPNTVPTSLSQSQFRSNLGQLNASQQYPPSSLSSNAEGFSKPYMPPLPTTTAGYASNVIGASRVPPTPVSTAHPQVAPSTGTYQGPPTSSGLYQQTSTGSFQVPPTSGAYQQTSAGSIKQVPSSSSGPYQQMPPTNYYQQTPPVSVGSYQKVPPSSGPPFQQVPPPGSYQQSSPMRGPYQQSRPPGLGPNQQMPPTNLGLNQQMPPLPSGGNYPLAPPGATNVMKPSPYPQTNQGPLPNQYPPQGASIQPQPVATGSPYRTNRYPQMAHNAAIDGLTNQLRATNVTQDGFNKLWGMDTVDLLKTRDLLPRERVEAPAIRLNPDVYDSVNCSPELFRCTLTKIPETKALLDKSRLPFGVLIHPFKDLNGPSAVDGKDGEIELTDICDTQLSVVQCSTIVRCRSCRTYINPFVFFVDNKRWKCNLCFRVNELPDEFQFDPVSKTYGDPSRRPEIKFATIEFIAPSEYMVRPPQPAIYLFLFDVSRLGAESGYLDIVCQTIIEELENLPGDARTSVGFITYDTSVHFYSLAEGLSQPHQMIVVDIDDIFLPCPENLLVNLNECHDLIKDLLTQLPSKYSESYVTESALGAALQAAHKLLAPTGGRITVFQSRLPSIGPGGLTAREDPSSRAGDLVPHLNPSTDFYKKLALDCSTQQIAVDLFLVNSQYVDVATLSGISRFSGGCMYHFPLFRSTNTVHVDSLKRTFQRYLSRKIGFESVMRLRCTRGLSIHTFHGNFFVRSTDLLSLPNVNPDAGFGMQVSIDENLTELQNVCFQAALLYTSSKGERRIRVHTLCLPVVTSLSDILHGADQHCIIGLLSKMAVDRSIESSVTDAREAFINVVADIMSAYKLTQNSGSNGCLLAPKSLRLIPLFILALLKSVAFRIGQSTRLDDRVFAMCQMKSLPLSLLIQFIYPDLYPVHNIEQQPLVDGEDGQVLLPPQRLHLSSEKLDSQGVFLLDNGTMILILVGRNVNPTLCQNFFGVPHFAALPQEMYELPELTTPESERLRDFVYLLQTEKPIPPCVQIIRDDSPHRSKFLEYFVEDKNEAGTSYYEFLQRIKVLMK